MTKNLKLSSGDTVLPIKKVWLRLVMGGSTRHFFGRSLHSSEFTTFCNCTTLFTDGLETSDRLIVEPVTLPGRDKANQPALIFRSGKVTHSRVECWMNMHLHEIIRYETRGLSVFRVCHPFFMRRVMSVYRVCRPNSACAFLGSIPPPPPPPLLPL